MTLSIIKLKELLISKGFNPINYFVMSGYYFYIELVCLKTSERIFLYIPSKYEIQVQDLENTYKIKEIEMDKKEEITDEYGNQPDVEDIYKNIDLEEDKEDLQSKLSKNYSKDIKLTDISDDDNLILKSIFRQIDRLKNCVKNLNYKLLF